MNFVGGRDTYEGRLFWEGRRRKNGEANGEVISVEFKERLFELDPACLRRRKDSIQNGGMNFVGGRGT